MINIILNNNNYPSNIIQYTQRLQEHNKIKIRKKNRKEKEIDYFYLLQARNQNHYQIV
jgi:hypothetical protein